MDFWKTILGLVRRKYIGLPVILLSAAVAALVFFLLPTHYTSSALLVLASSPAGGTTPQNPDEPSRPINPLLEFNDGLKTTAGILIQSTSTPAAAAELGASRDGPTKVTINDGSANPDLLGTDGPFVYVEGNSTSAAKAHSVVVRAQQLIRKELSDRQRALGAPRPTFLSIIDVVAPSAPEAQLGAKWQAAGVAFVITLCVGFGGAYGIERVMASRRLRAKDASADAMETATNPVPEPLASEPITNGASGSYQTDNWSFRDLWKDTIADVNVSKWD